MTVAAVSPRNSRGGHRGGNASRRAWRLNNSAGVPTDVVETTASPGSDGKGNSRQQEWRLSRPTPPPTQSTDSRKTTPLPVPMSGQRAQLQRLGCLFPDDTSAAASSHSGGGPTSRCQRVRFLIPDASAPPPRRPGATRTSDCGGARQRSWRPTLLPRMTALRVGRAVDEVSATV